jgi:FkbM family methyltransferase
MDLRAVNPELDDQAAELSLIGALVPHLTERSAIDVGSERGEVAAVLRSAGLGPMWLIEPFPGSAERLRERFGADAQVEVLEVAAGARDGTAELHLAADMAGGSRDAFHTLEPDRAGPELVWESSVEVPVRSLGSLSEAGDIPGRVGVLKIDAEGADADVLRGASGLSAEIVMVEFWGDLPDTLGRCPFELGELCSLVEELGPRRFLFVRHGRRHVSLGRWDVADPVEDEWGNLVFVSDHLVDAAEQALPEIEGALRIRSERITEEQEDAATARLEAIGRLSAEADARLELLKRGTVLGRLKAMLSRRRSRGSGRREALHAADDVEQKG